VRSAIVLKRLLGGVDVVDDAEVLGRDGARQVAETRSVVVAQPTIDAENVLVTDFRFVRRSWVCG
jgi:hypothetical protein